MIIIIKQHQGQISMSMIADVITTIVLIRWNHKFVTKTMINNCRQYTPMMMIGHKEKNGFDDLLLFFY